MTFEEALKLVEEKASVYWGTYRVENLVNDLQETYAPKIKMTSEQKDKFMLYKEDEDIQLALNRFSPFEKFWFCTGSCGNLYKNLSENQLMLAWLHPELIEVVE